MNRLTRYLVSLLFTGGIGLLVALIAHYGAGEIFDAVAAAGYGVLVVTAWHLVPVVLDTLAWSALLPAAGMPTFRRLVAMRWVGEAVNALLPSAQVGGDLARAHLLMRSGVAGSTAAASVVVNLTLLVVALFLFCLTGAVALLVHLRPAGSGFILAGLVLLALSMTLSLVFLQRAGLFQRMARLVSRLVPTRDVSSLLAGAGSLDVALRETWARLDAVGASTAWALTGWFAGVGEVWLAFHFLGHPVGLLEALILESLLQAIRNGAFFIPGALGVQEGGAVLLGALFGVAPETALALSLLKRARELLLGLPGLVAWQWWSGMGLLGGTRDGTARGDEPGP